MAEIESAWLLKSGWVEEVAFVAVCRAELSKQPMRGSRDETTDAPSQYGRFADDSGGRRVLWSIDEEAPKS